MEDGPSPIEDGMVDLAKGVRYDVPPHGMDLGEATLAQDVRFDKRGVQKDIGDSLLGSVEGRILCLLEHKYIDAVGIQQKALLALVRTTSGRARTYIWNEQQGVWSTDASTATGSLSSDVGYVRGVSVQGVALFALGAKAQLLQRSETINYTSEGEDFPAGNSLTGLGDSTQLTYSPTHLNIEDNEITFNYDVDISITSGTFITVTLGFYRNGELLTTKDYTNSSSGTGETWNNETEAIVGVFNDGDTFSIKIEDIADAAAGTSETSGAFSDQNPSTPRYQATKNTVNEAVSDIYTFRFTIEVAEGNSDTVEFWADSGSGFSKIDEYTYEGPLNQEVTYDIVVDGMGNGDKFGIDYVPAEGSFFISNFEPVEWTEESSNFSIDVHGHNVATDGDTGEGITYDYESSRSPTLAFVTGAPDAFWVESFADRVITLRDGGDSQDISWSADGDVDEFSSGDSGGSTLIDARGDAINDLMAAAPLGSDVLAVFRARSIMRAFETGNFDLAVGVVHWQEGLGTESPFSVTVTPIGILFLAHDLMVYSLTESGPTPVGGPIHEELQDLLDEDDLDTVDGEYDPIHQEYWLSTPSESTVWIFDVGEFLERQILRWRSKNLTTRRLGIVSAVD